ncbi:uncharacterized protein IWZ02DRAFT_452046 [Phyllosticta citriasiana]|uniref:uncharacterized protein n=1 Tax=Phyllosticta citriasiana TaxID=595635 RepID=UPI0030FD564B
MRAPVQLLFPFCSFPFFFFFFLGSDRGRGTAKKDSFHGREGCAVCRHGGTGNADVKLRSSIITGSLAGRSWLAAVSPSD